jgi:hypothetical protein
MITMPNREAEKVLVFSGLYDIIRIIEFTAYQPFAYQDIAIG